MTQEEKLNLLKKLIDEDRYPVFDDVYLLAMLEYMPDVIELAASLCVRKAAVPDIRLGDIEIKNNKDYFLQLAKDVRKMKINEDGEVERRYSDKRMMVRADGR